MTQSKSLSSEMLERKLKFLVQIFRLKHHKKKYLLLLKGFIKNHLEQECYEMTCPLRHVIKTLDNNTEVSNKKAEDLFFAFVNQEYLNGLIKYQDDFYLRLAYSLFLYHYYKKTYKAKLEFEKIEEYSLPIDIQFVVWRYHKMIDEGEQDVKHAVQGEVTEELDVVSEIAYESHFRQCSYYILRSAKNFSEFWSIILNQNASIDLKKLNFLSSKVNEYLKNVNNHWNRLQHYKPNAPKACKMYANFTKEILNKPKESFDILMKCKDAKLLSSNLNLNRSYNECQEELTEGCGIISCLYDEVILYK